MSGPTCFTQWWIRAQLIAVEDIINTSRKDHYDWCHYKYRRYYLLKRLLALQLKEFDNEMSSDV